MIKVINNYNIYINNKNNSYFTLYNILLIFILYNITLN